MQKYQEFKNKWLGKGIDYDGAYGFQCFDVINQYILEMTGQKPYIRLNWADEIFKRPNDIIPAGVPYTRITNNETPNNFPIQGDIIVWDKAKWNGFGGHTGVVDRANADNGTVLQQNGLTQLQPCQIVDWNFYSATPLGWIRLQQQPTTPPTPQPNPEFKEVYPDNGDGLWNLCKKAGYPVIPTNEPNHEPTNSICYNRISELNGTNSVIYGKSYKVDFDPVKWFNSRSQPQATMNDIKPQPEAITTPAQPTMPTIKIEEPKPEPVLDIESFDKINELKKENDELRQQIVAKLKLETNPDLKKESEQGKFDFSKLSVGVVSAKNPITTPPIFGTIGGAIGVLTQSEPEITAALTLIGLAWGLLYPIASKFLDRLKLIAEALNSKK